MGDLYARARATDDGVFDLDLGNLQARTRQVRREARRLTWRAAMQRRAITVSAALSRLVGAVGGEEVKRTKVGGAWLISAAGVPVIVLTSVTPGRTVAELAEPLTLRVLRADRVDIEKLRAVEREGVASVVDEQPEAT